MILESCVFRGQLFFSEIMTNVYIVQIRNLFECKIVNSFLSCVLGVQKNRLIEMGVLVPTAYVLVEKEEK